MRCFRLATTLFLLCLHGGAQAASTLPGRENPAHRVASATIAPVLGVDYQLISPRQPTYGQGEIEVAEVFSYRCIHCAEFQPSVNSWKKTMPAGVRWEYVPAAFGGSWDDFARAYFAAEILGAQARTHDAVFKGVFVDKLVTTGSPDEIADMYATWGLDRAKFLGVMQSFGVTAKLGRARQFALRTGIRGTPTIIVNGKYRVEADPGFAKMLATVSYLIAKEKRETKPTVGPTALGTHKLGLGGAISSD